MKNADVIPAKQQKTLQQLDLSFTSSLMLQEQSYRFLEFPDATGTVLLLLRKPPTATPFPSNVFRHT